MKPVKLLAALLVTASTSIGCNHCDPSELIVYWTFTKGSGQATTSCSAAGVTTLHAFIDGVAFPDAFTGSFDLRCVDYDAAGGFAIGVGPGHHDVQIDALDANGALLYQAARGDNLVNVNSCGATVDNVNVPAVAGSLSLTLTGPVFQCPFNSFVWYSLTDLTTNTVVDLVNGTRSPQALPCNGTVPLLSGLPFGPYQIDFVEVVSPDLNTGLFVPKFANCTAQQFSHSADDSVPIQVSLSSNPCPGQ